MQWWDTVNLNNGDRHEFKTLSTAGITVRDNPFY